VTPLIVSRFDNAGGAARAALRLAIALRDIGTPCEMLVGAKATDYDWVLGRRSFTRDARAMIRSVLGSTVETRLQKAGDGGIRSINRLPSRLDRTINAMPHDVVNLHWIGSEQVSIEAIGRIEKPVVWTLHDMWAFAGAEHLPPVDAQARWRTGYTPQNRPPGQSGLDLDRQTWLRKRKAWRQPRHVVCPSSWLAARAKESALMGEWPIHVIPNPLDLDVFRPWPKKPMCRCSASARSAARAICTRAGICSARRSITSPMRRSAPKR
jgi:glycosyltransferase involved in cell wall biosynthesis